MSRFIKAKEGPKRTVIYTDENGKNFEYSGGDPNWRTNNPGNLRPGKISKKNGEIGKALGFAVFPDYETGHIALLDCLKTTYGNAGLSAMIKDFAPSHENDTIRYLRFLRKRTGVKNDRKIRDFTEVEFEKLWKAIELMEGKKRGKIRELSEKSAIIKVLKNKKGTITAYFIEGLGWVSKAQGIALAKAGKVDAVIAVSRSGNPFLRAHPDVIVENNLKNLG